MPVRILFVCYENICRSPMAEGVFRKLSGQYGLESLFEAGSAGTVCYQSGSQPDSRALRAAARRGIDISGIRARCIHDLELRGYDRIFVMDHENYRDVADALDPFSPIGLHLMSEFAHDGAGEEIEDPYYGPESGFDATLERLSCCAESIIRQLAGAYGSVPEEVQPSIR